MDWSPLSKTDYINVVWTSAAPSLAENISLEQFMDQLNQVVKGYGLAGVHYNLNDVDPTASFTGYYANSDNNRANAFRETLLNPNTKAIWCGRGGFGAAEIIQIYEKEGFTLPNDRVIPIIGFSDVTALHLFAAKYKWPTLHAPVANFSREMNSLTGESVNNETSIKPLIDILKGDLQEVVYTLKNLNHSAIEQPQYQSPITTRIVGSNFSIVQRSAGTATQLNADEAIIFFEDTQDDIHRLRSLLVGVARTGLFDNATALFFGSLPVSGGSLEELLMDFTKILKEERGINKPILLNSSFGHGAVNQVLPLGTRTTLTFNSDGNAIIKASTNKSA